MRPRLSGGLVGLALVATVPLVLLASVPTLPVAARVPIVLGFVLFVPGAAVAHVLALDDAPSFGVVAVGVSVALLLALSEVSVLTVGLSPRLILGGLIATTVAGVGVRTVVRMALREDRRRRRLPS